MNIDRLSYLEWIEDILFSLNRYILGGATNVPGHPLSLNQPNFAIDM